MPDDNEQQGQVENTSPPSADDAGASVNMGLSGDLDVQQADPSEVINNDTDEDLSDWAAALAEQDKKEEAKSMPHAGVGEFEDFTEPMGKKPPHTDIEMILDIPVQITAELGRTRMDIRNLLRLAHGSVIELDGMAGEPMDVLVNGTLIARGEVVVVNDRFGIRLTDIITPAERIRKLNQ